MMSGSEDSVGPESMTTFYREKMNSYLRGSPLPPTEWELRNHHEHLHQEVLSRFRSVSMDEGGRGSSSPASSPLRSSSSLAGPDGDEGHKKRSGSETLTERFLEESISQAFTEAKKCHKEMRSKVLIDSVLGRKNYVGHADH